MIASDFEYRHRFWIIVLVYAAACALYNINHVNALYSIVPWNRGVLPALRPRIEDDGQSPRWGRALWDQAFQWGFVATLLAFAFTWSDPIGYAFGGATFAFLLLQMLARIIWSSSRRSPSPSP